MEAGVSLPLVSVLPGDDSRLSVVSISLTKEHVYLLEFRPAGLLVGSSHSADLLGLDVQKWVFPCRSKVGWSKVVLPPLRTDLDTKVLPALASSVTDVSSSSIQRWLIGNIRSVEQVSGSDRQDPVLSIAQMCRNVEALLRVPDLIVAGSPFIDAAIKDPTSSTWSSSTVGDNGRLSVDPREGVKAMPLPPSGFSDLLTLPTMMTGETGLVAMGSESPNLSVPSGCFLELIKDFGYGPNWVWCRRHVLVSPVSGKLSARSPLFPNEGRMGEGVSPSLP